MKNIEKEERLFTLAKKFIEGAYSKDESAKAIQKNASDGLTKMVQSGEITEQEMHSALDLAVNLVMKEREMLRKMFDAKLVKPGGFLEKVEVFIGVDGEFYAFLK